MASSTLPPDPTPPPREEVLDTVAAQVAALDEIVGYARSHVQVFDVDLSEHGWNNVGRIEALAAFLRASETARLDIIVHDTRWIEATAARLMLLLRTFGHAITIYRTGTEAQMAADPLTIVDGRHCLHRYHIEQPRATLIVDTPLLVKPLATRFDEIWGTGEPGVTGTVLGL